MYATAAAVAMGCCTLSAQADDAAIIARIDAMQRQLEAQQQEIASQKAEIERLRTSLKDKPRLLKAEGERTPSAPEVGLRDQGGRPAAADAAAGASDSSPA
jgi:septal ring factor EnvC (AmiA/AmiB activator)